MATAIPTLYGFITDELFWNKQVVDLNKSVNTGLGFIDDITVNYFNKIGIVSDPRTARLNILGETVTGPIRVFFDVKQMNATTGPFVGISDADTIKLFNIIERCYLTQGMSDQALNTELGGSTDLYGIFVANSATRSVKSTKFKPAAITSTLTIYDYIEFDVVINTIQTHFKLWINSNAFSTNYPISTITKVIPSCKPEYLLDPTLMKTPITAVIDAGSFIFDNMNVGTTNIDNTGVLNYRTKWVISSQNIPEIRFSVLYQGAMPSSLEARAAIRAYLESLGEHNNVWESRFPDLYITAQFFVIPQWGTVIARPNSKDGVIYPAINDYSSIFDVLKRMFPSFDVTWVNDKSEVLINSYNCILMASLPDPLNDANSTSLLTLFPTYQAYGPDESSFAYQEAEAQDFSRKLSQAMSILYGSATIGTTGFSTNIFYGKRFLSFTVARKEIHVLYKEDFSI